MSFSFTYYWENLPLLCLAEYRSGSRGSRDAPAEPPLLELLSVSHCGVQVPIMDTYIRVLLAGRQSYWSLHEMIVEHGMNIIEAERSDAIEDAAFSRWQETSNE